MLFTNFRWKYVLYKLVVGGFQLFDTGRLHPVRERAIRDLGRSVDYVERHMTEAIGLETQREVLEYALSQTQVPGHYLEFGVYTGGTTRFLARQIRKGRKGDGRIHGFDSFEGLPQAWSGFNLGPAAFSTGGKLPRVPANVVLHKGWFSETIPKWCGEVAGPVAFIHVDCDLYSSTVDVLEALRERMQPGTVIVFDEYFNYPNWEQHEFKAWREFVARHRVAYEYLAFARQQVAVRIRGMGASDSEK
jgi:predicted O-methyltransferase YrrM